MIGALVNMIIFGNILSTCDCEYNKACKIDEYLDIKNCSCKKRLIGELLLTCEAEILNTTEISLDNKKVACLIHTYLISLVTISVLLLIIVSIGCYYFYKRYWNK